jgi:hypothetical protein
MTRLEQLHSEKRLKLVKTDVLDTELSAAKGTYAGLARRKSHRLAEDIGTWVLGHSRLGRTRLGGDDDPALHDALAMQLFGKAWGQLHPRQVRDVMIVATHLKHGRDILVTLDNALLDAAGALRKRFGVTLMTPEDCLDRLNGTI